MGFLGNCKKDSLGGLGIQSAKGRNLALLAKLSWRYQLEGSSLWAQVLKGKYCSTRRINLSNRDRLPCSRVWFAMKKGAGVFQKGVRWTIGRESNLSLWNDSWTKMGPLRQAIQGPLTREAMDLRVRDVVSVGGWDWTKIPFVFSDPTKLELQAIPVVLASRGGDKLTWIDSEHGTFNIGSTYKLATKVGHGA